ncbi:hypothetical protein TrCOL_g6236 [Triparma columacea]|uniref:HMA domain-containing protein n=1 Tax=Triparma columacea TaxID=722753 RepID=A0A9W7G345_9STRA|nr:hypothetical protein TrCOL_g6236 [Triparma columacea]
MIGVIAKFPIVRSLLSHNYEGLRMIMLESAQRWKWWGAISLLASSCCALQVVLNFFSLGCAGFNTVLGPLRPPLLAMAFALQTTAWMEIRAQPLLWRKTLVGSLLTITLSLLPECLHLLSKFRSRLASTPSSSPDLVFNLKSSIGCSSCEVKVQSTVLSHPLALSCEVSEGLASVYLKPDASPANTSGTRGELCSLLSAAGFAPE